MANIDYWISRVINVSQEHRFLYSLFYLYLCFAKSGLTTNGGYFPAILTGNIRGFRKGVLSNPAIPGNRSSGWGAASV